MNDEEFRISRNVTIVLQYPDRTTTTTNEQNDGKTTPWVWVKERGKVHPERADFYELGRLLHHPEAKKICTLQLSRQKEDYLRRIKRIDRIMEEEVE